MVINVADGPELGELLASIGRMHGSADVDAALAVAVEGACRFVGAEYGVLVALSDAGEADRFTTFGFCDGELERFDASRQAEGLQLFAHLLGLGAPFRSADWPEFVRAFGIPASEVHGRNFLGTPMGPPDRPLGYFLLMEKSNGGTFGDRCEAMLKLFAGEAANALENARAQASERELKAELDAVLSTLPAGVVVFRHRGKGAPLVNQEAQRLLADLSDPGQSTESLLSALEVRRADGTLITRDDLLRGETVWCERIELSAADGRSLQLLAHARPVYSGGAVAAAAVALQDLRPIRDVERMHAEFLATVSHELRVPLSAIKGAVSTLLEEVDGLSRAEMREYCRVAVEQSDLVRSLVSDLLDVGRVEAGVLSVHPEPSDLTAAIEQARGTAAAASPGHSICIDVAAGLPQVMIDRDRIAQVLANLLSNAAQHSREGSSIQIEASRDGAYVEVSVRDEGSGFASEEGPRLFRLFASGNAGGTGLGLAVAKGLVEAHGGRIRAESPGLGQGAAFSFTVPVATTTRTIERPAATEQSARILVVDDDPHALRFARDALLESGHHPLVTGDHREIPRLLVAERPDLALLDLVLPGTDAIELLRRLPGLAEMPVIVMSAYNREETIAAALDAGARDYIVKPFGAVELSARIRAVLRQFDNGPGSFRLGELLIDYESRSVCMGGDALSLTATEYDLLRVLSLEAGKVVTFDALMRKVWKRRGADARNLMRMTVSNLRRKLGDSAAAPAFIFSARSVGYRLGSRTQPDQLDDAAKDARSQLPDGV